MMAAPSLWQGMIREMASMVYPGIIIIQPQYFLKAGGIHPFY
jgi:hypothetical protein